MTADMPMHRKVHTIADLLRHVAWLPCQPPQSACFHVGAHWLVHHAHGSHAACRTWRYPFILSLKLYQVQQSVNFLCRLHHRFECLIGHTVIASAY